MKLSRSWYIGGVLFVAVSALLPLARRTTFSATLGGCSWDAAPIHDRYRVRLTLADRSVRSFCSLWCAETWYSAERGALREAWLTDETTGATIPLCEAVIVESSVASNPLANDRRHVFQSRVKADEHARRFRGRVLGEEERPFRDWKSSRRSMQSLGSIVSQPEPAEGTSP